MIQAIKKVHLPLGIGKEHLSVLSFLTTVFLGGKVCPVNETSSVIRHMTMVLKFHAMAKYNKNRPSLWKYQDRD
jgi:hypothetical protein